MNASRKKYSSDYYIIEMRIYDHARSTGRVSMQFFIKVLWDMSEAEKVEKK